MKLQRGVSTAESEFYPSEKKDVAGGMSYFFNKGGPYDRYKWGEITPINGPKIHGVSLELFHPTYI